MKTRRNSGRRTAILSGEHAESLPPAKFERFTARPVNYYRGVVHESEERESQWDEKEVSRRMDQQMGVERAVFSKERNAAYRKGFEEGMARGREEGSQQIQPAVELLQDWGRVIQSEKQELARRYESDVLDLGFRIAEKIIGIEIVTRNDAILGIVRQALRKIVNADEVVLRVNPEDLKILEQARDKLIGEMGANSPLELRADSSIARGGCMIETESGMLDAQLQSQIERLRTQLMEEQSGASG
jgi:flagellar assembly protein FliH